MTSEIGVRPIDYSEELGGKDAGHWLREQRRQKASERDRGLDILRSGSAPPTVEGSLTAVGGLFSHHGDVWSAPSNKREISEDELRSDPAYINYYFSHVNLNPRLPPPLLSKEDWRTAQRLSGGGSGAGGSVIGGIGDMRKAEIGSNNSMFSAQLGFSGEKEENEGDYKNEQNEWGGDGLIGLPGFGLGTEQKSIAEFLQDDLHHNASMSKHPSQPASRNSIEESIISSGGQYAQLEHEISSAKLLRSASKNSVSASLSYASAVGAPFARSSSTDPHLIARTPSPRVPPVGDGRANSTDKRAINGPTSFNDISGNTSDSADLAAALSGMNLAGECMTDEEKCVRSQFPQGINDHQNMFHQLQAEHGHLKKNMFLNSADSRSFQHSMSQSPKGSYSSMSKSNGLGMDRNNYYMRTDGQMNYHKHSGSCSPSNYHSIGSPSSAIPNYSLSGPNMNPALASMMASQLGNGNLPMLFENAGGSHLGGGGSGLDSRVMGGGLASGANYMAAAAELQNIGRAGNQQVIDPMYLQYLKAAELASSHINDNAMDLLALQKAYMGSLLSPTKSNCGGHFLGKSGGFNPGYYGNQALALEMAYGGNPLINSLLPNSPVGPGSPMRQSDRNMRLASGMRNLAAGGMGGWRSEAGGIMDQCFSSSLLDEFKSNKTKCFELSEIATHVVEFSADQYGSRFIQQKLETATAEEKTMVFHEILPHALALMTDVFGNYVIQKFFEHGTSAQIRELANKLTGHVLTLSLQMYGCRVIQKAIEVVDLDQQKKMVIELDGNIMRCVRDQNGNHVIQKCIECIPEDAIHFIVSTFYEQVVILSTHPYGCRVIQRVLEHCHDPKTQQIVMDEIMQSVCMLAQDQYGNYVVQHVLEHGKPHERSAIITKLTGKIVQMSQQKFASNVVEKCLTFGDPVERRAIITEMLGTTDENEPLQAMMKDQFGNYVVQKVLETCDDQQLEMILMRIKIHLNALKKYTYGKHIVARVEKLVAAGERRIVMQASYGAAA